MPGADAQLMGGSAVPWGLHVGPRAGPEGTVSTGASREDAVLPTLLHFGPAPGSPSVPQCPPVPHCPNVLLSVLQYPPAPQRPPGASVVLQCPSVPLYPRVSVSPGDEEPLPMDRSRARGSLPQDTPGGGENGKGAEGGVPLPGPPLGGGPARRERRKRRRKAGGEGGRWFCPTPPPRAGKEEGGQRPGAARAPPGGRRGRRRRGRTDGRTDGAQRPELSARPEPHRARQVSSRQRAGEGGAPNRD